jgi:hypothetical protein
MAVARRAIADANADFIPVDVAAHPVCDKQGAPAEPIELSVFLVVQNQKSSQVDEKGMPVYSTREIRYNDHHLSTTLETKDASLLTRHLDDPAAIERAHAIKLSPQDALQLTLTEGRAYLGQPVDCGNITIQLLGMWVPASELKTHAAWQITFYSATDAGKVLNIWVDTQTGAILKHDEK